MINLRNPLGDFSLILAFSLLIKVYLIKSILLLLSLVKHGIRFAKDQSEEEMDKTRHQYCKLF